MKRKGQFRAWQFRLDWNHATQDFLGDFRGAGPCSRSVSAILVGRRRDDSSAGIQLVVGVSQRVVHVAGDSIGVSFLSVEMSARRHSTWFVIRES